MALSRHTRLTHSGAIIAISMIGLKLETSLVTELALSLLIVALRADISDLVLSNLSENQTLFMLVSYGKSISTYKRKHFSSWSEVRTISIISGKI